MIGGGGGGDDGGEVPMGMLPSPHQWELQYARMRRARVFDLTWRPLYEFKLN